MSASAAPAPERVAIYDTTLRDGLQSPGVAVDADGRLEIARLLCELGVDAIEAGFPALGEDHFVAVQRVAREVDGSVVKALARARTDDVDRAWDAVRDAGRPRITVYVPTSDVRIERLMTGGHGAVLSATRTSIARARSLAQDVEFSPMDATRAQPDFLAEVVSIAIAEGAGIISVPDTVGHAMPHEFTALLRQLQADVRSLATVVLGVHCHDDLGLAVANSLAALLAGARSVECTVNGLGERAGNASLEELVTLLHTRGDDLGLRTDVDSSALAPAARLVSRLTGYPVPSTAIWRADRESRANHA